MQKIHRLITVFEEILLDLHHNLARIAWLIQVKSNLDQHWKFSRGKDSLSDHSSSLVYSNPK